MVIIQMFEEELGRDIIIIIERIVVSIKYNILPRIVTYNGM